MKLKLSTVHSACHSSRINCFASMCVSDPSFHFLPNLTAHWMQFRLTESIKHEIYEELPLFEIEQKWGGTEAGKNLAGTYLPSSFSSCSFLWVFSLHVAPSKGVHRENQSKFATQIPKSASLMLLTSANLPIRPGWSCTCPGSSAEFHIALCLSIC